MISRLINLIKAKLNKGLSDLETPEILAEHAQEQLEANLKKIKDAVVTSLTTQKELETQIKKNKDDIANWEKRAAVAVQQNNDEVARQCLQKKLEVNNVLGTLTAQLEAQTQSTADLKTRYKEIEQQLKEFANKKDNILAREKASDAVSKANQLASGAEGTSTAKWESKIAAKEAKAEAMRQLGGGPSPVEEKFAQLDQHIEVEDELAALKKNMGSTKLIVDTGSGASPAKTVVDENLPMVVEDDKKKGDKK